MQNLNWYYDLVPHTRFPALQTICSVLNLRSRCFIATFPLFLPSLLFVFRNSIVLRALELMGRIVAQYMKLSTDGLKHSHSVNSRYELFSSIYEFKYRVFIYEVLIILLYHFTWLSSNLVSSTQFDCRYVAHSWLVPL